MTAVPARTDVGALLVDDQQLRPEALEALRRESDTSGRPLWAVLLDNGHCSDEALFRSLHGRTGLPVLVNTSFNTAGRPMVDSPRDALECFGSSPLDMLAMGPFTVRRP